MLPFSQTPISVLTHANRMISVFPDPYKANIDPKSINSFSDEWMKFDHFKDKEIESAGKQYFDIMGPEILTKDSVVLDIGCGSGRWSKYISKNVKWVEAIDPSQAVLSAAALTKDLSNIRISKASVDNIPFADNSFDVVFSLGVLHHIPDTAAAMKKCVAKVKANGWFLVYLYYKLDNRGIFYKWLFYLSNLFRKIISSLPSVLKLFICDLIAFVIYLPLISFSKIVRMVLPSSNLYKKIPLSYYCDKSFNIIRNDALDRFGTPLEQRFSKNEIEQMMRFAGLTNIKFSPNEPYWHAIGQKI